MCLGGLHIVGACRLPPPFDGCQPENRIMNTCYNKNGRLSEIERRYDFNNYHSFDEVVLDQDAKFVDPLKVAFINHIQFYRFNYPWLYFSDMLNTQYFVRIWYSATEKGK